MNAGEPLRHCPQCGADIERTIRELREAIELSFCFECKFPLLLVAGKYRLMRWLDRGGFGEIYLAHHIHLKRDYERVVKLIDPKLLKSSSLWKRFQREVQFTCLLSIENNHFVRIYDDFGEVDKLGYFYVMEYLKGIPLRRLLDDSDNLPPLDLCFHIFDQLCDAMQTAHERNVVHRDLKPDNIFIIRRGRDPYFVKVLDFGIAKPLGKWGDHVSLHTQGSLGTPLYMSPEQCGSNDIDHRADIYAMGIVLYEMLVGRTPFGYAHEPLSPMELMIARLQTKPLAPHIARSDRQIPQNVSALVLKALNSEPTERFNTVREWREQLEEAFIEAGLWPNRVELCALDPEERWGLQAIADCDAQELIPQENHKPKFGDIHQAELDPDGVKERKVLRKAEHSGPVESSADAQSEIDMLPRYHHLLGPPSEECLQLTLQEIGKDEGKLAKANTHEQRVELFAQVQVLQRTPDAGHCLNNADVLLRETGDNSHRAGQYKNSSPKINGFNSNNYSRSGAYDLSHEPRDGDEEDEVDLSFRPSRLWIVAAILVLCAIGVGSFWMLQQLDQHRTTEPTTLTKREICGKVGESWPDRALRVLVLPLAVKAPSSQKAREQDRHRHYMQSLFQTTLERLFEMTYTLRRDFLAVSESKWVVAQPDPKLNQKQATMAGTLCQADLVLSGAWLTAHAEQSSVLQGISIVDPSPSSEPRHWLRLFATYTGTVLSWEQTQAPKKIIKPAALDELVQVNDREFVPQQVKSLLQGLVFFAAAKNLQDNNRLFRKLAEKAIVELGKAGVHLPTPHFASQNIPPQSSVLIQAGPFFMGKPNKAQISYLPDFEMDRYEVSREDYAICVIRGLCRPIERWMDPPWDYPRDRVTTADATQYCRMRGMELPTEAQWVKAARGGIQISNKLNPHPKRRYPWGDDEANCKRSNIRWCYKSEKEGQVIPTLLPYYHQLEGISPYGIHHLIGNASEILRDGSLKGGSCFSRDPFISWKEYMDQRSGLSWVGFRCAKQQP